jgi:hypothetical protein
MREPLIALLAFSSSYGNVYAQVRFSNICNSYRGEKGKSNPVKHYFKASHAFLKKNVFKGKVKKSELPPYYCGLICEHYCLMAKAEKWFKKGAAMEDPWSAYECAMNLEHAFERNEIFSKLSNKRNAEVASGLSLLVEAEHTENQEQQIATFEQAGKIGIPEAYQRCALYLESRADAPIPIILKFYALAAQDHLLEGYKGFANCCLRLAGQAKDDPDSRAVFIRSAEQAYIAAGNQGDREAFQQLRKLLFAKNERMAEEMYIRSQRNPELLEKLKAIAGCSHE